jgi:hypothetical protein
MARLEKDSIDLNALRDTVASMGYRMIAERHAVMETALLRELVNADSFEKTRFLQGQIQALARSRDVPKILEAEIRAKQKKRGVIEPE